MQKLPMHTKNIADENFKKLAELFPQAVTEVLAGHDENGKAIIERAIDKDVLMAEIAAKVVDGPNSGENQRYQFTWPDKAKTVHASNQPIYKTLRPCREESVNFDDTENLYIEGDNLEVLKLLQESYLGKVKMIYIDPPYNTGNDFVYNDRFTMNGEDWDEVSGNYDEEGNRLFKNTDSNGRFHTDWLNMLYPRLKIARDLLSDDGVIFISIDDNEVHNLRKICDEVFGVVNFVAQLIWKSGGTSAEHFTNEHEYILCIAKNKNELPYFEFKGDAIISDRAIKRPSIKNPVSQITFPKGMDFECEDKIFPSEFGGVETVKVVEGVFEVKDRKLASTVTLEAAWTMKEMVENWLKGNIVTDQKGQVLKRFFFKGNGVLQYEKQKGTIHPKSIIEGFTTKQGGISLKNTLGKDYFDFSKSNGLMHFLAGVCTKQGDIILDFFSGSATTAHAVMQLNAEDGGKRKFIMVQLPEATDEKSEAFKAGYTNICEIGKERIRRAGAKIRAEIEDANKPAVWGDTLWGDGHKMGGDDKPIPDVGFRVLKVDSTNMEHVYYTPKEYTQNLLVNLEENIKKDRTPEDLLFQVMLELAVPLSNRIEELTIDNSKVFSVESAGQKGYLIACFESKIQESTVEHIAKERPYYFVMRDSSIGTDSLSTNFEQIFAAYSPDTQLKVL